MPPAGTPSGMNDENQPQDADDVLTRQESVAAENEDEKMRPAGEAGRVSDAEEARKRLYEDVEGDEPEPQDEADTGAQS